MHGEYDAVRYFSRTPNPRYRNAIWTTEYRATRSTVETAARYARVQDDVREIHILSGTHGARAGDRDFNHLHPPFLGEDIHLAKG
ncbi:hypothetical protein FAIPA1_350025 [Frankia sp. AiPs1]